MSTTEVIDHSGTHNDIEVERSWKAEHLWNLRPVRELFLLLTFVSVIVIAWSLRSALIPVFIGLLAAYTAEPFLKYVEDRWQFQRGTVLWVLLGAVIIICLVAGVFLVPQFMKQASELSEKIPEYLSGLEQRLNQISDGRWAGMLRSGGEQSAANQTQLLQKLASGVSDALGLAVNMAGLLMYSVSIVVLVPLYFGFFAWKFPSLTAALKSLIPEKNRRRVLRIGRRMDSAVGDFLRGRLMVAAIMMALFSAAFAVAEVPYWFVLGCFTGLISFVPYLPVVGCGLAMLLMWFEFGGGSSDFTTIDIIARPVIAYSVVQLAEGWLLTPWIQSQSVNLDAVTIMVVLMFGGAVGGVVGLLLAIPVTCCVMILIDEFAGNELQSAVGTSQHGD
ncbi:MAG: AI-2E family transporter [Planctomycetaceae bacterium]|nr:AI-2E family transporter [Planctomycetaceae bacterium]